LDANHLSKVEATMGKLHELPTRGLSDSEDPLSGLEGGEVSRHAAHS
jgi:hypothetical protein